jgi:hypothetical protein
MYTSVKGLRFGNNFIFLPQLWKINKVLQLKQSFTPNSWRALIFFGGRQLFLA